VLVVVAVLVGGGAGRWHGGRAGGAVVGRPGARHRSRRTDRGGAGYGGDHSGDYGGDYDGGYPSEEGVAAEPAPASPESRSSLDSSVAPEIAQVPGVPVGGVQRELVRSAQLTIEVDDSVARTRQVRTAAAALGALVVEEQASKGGAWLTLRVPSDALDRLIDEVAGLGTVVDRSGQVIDATEEVVDLDARVASQRASVDRIRALLTQAQTIGDIVAIESELASRQSELDSLTARLTALRDQVAMSTLTVDLRGPDAPVPPVDPGPGGFLDGLAAGWAGLLAVGTAAAAVAGFVLPLLPVVALVAGIGWLVRRVLRGRRRPAPAGPAASGADGGA
jgi:hypothetical protein